MDNIVDKNSYNSMTKTRFILDIDMSSIIGSQKDKLKNFSLNCSSVSTPEIIAGVTYTSYQGYVIPLPNGNREEEKQLEITFTLSENMIQYAVMLKWLDLVAPQLQDGKTYDVSEDCVTSANLWPLDSYLKPLKVPIQYEGMFITRLGKLEFDQNDQDGNIMTCSASFVYFKSTFDVDKIIESN